MTKILPLIIFYLALNGLGAENEIDTSEVKNIPTCNLNELENLPWTSSASTIEEKMTQRGFNECYMKDLGNRMTLGPQGNCSCHNVSIGILYRWWPPPYFEALDKFMLKYRNLQQCHEALVMYTNLDYILDSTLEPLSVDIYRRRNKSDTLCTFIWDFCEKGNILEVYRYDCVPANKPE